MQKDLKLIKAKFGEEMSNFCRDNFSTILEKEGVLSALLLNCFHPNKELLKDIKEEDKEQQFITYVNSQIGIGKKTALVETIKTPFELMEEAGYDLYHCRTEEEVQQFKKYYEPNESLCTFKSNRTASRLVFFAVKKNASEIKRKNFKKPNRQDDYGTSVISIQFRKLNYRTSLSIKNRYNHAVDNPDATFSNNLENIIEGLTYSFNKNYNLNITDVTPRNFELKNYTFEIDLPSMNSRMYKFNQEVDEVYYCKDNIIIYKGNAIKLPKEQYIIIGTHIVDLQSKDIYCYYTARFDNRDSIRVNRTLKNIGISNRKKDTSITLRIAIMQPSGKWIKINYNQNGDAVSIDNVENIDNSKVTYRKDSNNKILEKSVKIKNRNSEAITTILLDEKNNIISCKDIEINTIKATFILPLYYHKKDSFALSFEEVEKIKILKNQNSKEIRFQNQEKEDIVIVIDESSNIIEYHNPTIKELKPKFLQNNKTIEVFKTPNVTVIRENVLENNEKMRKLDISKAESIGHRFMNKNNTLTSINIAAAKDVGPYCFEKINPSTKVDMSTNVNIGYGNFKRTKGKVHCLK